MKTLFDDRILRRFNLLAIPVVAVWSLWSGAGFYLSSGTTERYAHTFEPFFEIYPLARPFGIVQGGGVMRTETTTTLVPQPHRINAIIRSHEGSYVSISDPAGSSVVQLGGTYKKAYRLIGLNDTIAIFKGYGKTSRLRLGMEDNLYREETITRSVTDPSKGGNEWLTIPYQTLASQMRDVQGIWKKIRINEVRAGSKIDGFRIYTIAPDSVFARIGLEQGDIIKSVNNKKIESYADAFAVYSQVPRMHSIRISVVRNNLPKDLIYEITR